MNTHTDALAEIEARARTLGLDIEGLAVTRIRRARERRINGLAQAITDAVLEAQDAAEIDGLTPDQFARELLATVAHILGVEQ